MDVHFNFRKNIERSFDEIDPRWRSYDALVLAGTHSPNKDGVERAVDLIWIARETQRPLYAECFGHQLVAIEYARNVLGIKDATSEEFGKGTFVVKKKDKLNVGWKDGESYWNNYEVVIDVKSPEWFFTSQAHPSYQSWKKNKHPLIVSFLEYARKMAV